jgi:predicted CXXCH cytochrome family protein
MTILVILNLGLVFFFLVLNSEFASALDCTTSSCHSEIKHFKKIHGPNKVNGCVVCHKISQNSEAVASGNLPKRHPQISKLLPKDINSTCLLCHDDKSGVGFAVIHKVISEKSCISCHNPHGSNNKFLLKFEKTSDLCFSCHKDFTDQEHGGHRSVIIDNKSCFNCHESHFSHEKNLLKTNVSQLCFQCHNKVIEKSNGISVSNIKIKMDLSLHKHKPFEEGKCQSCHKPHGNGVPAFLVKTYTKSDHQLCFECHKNIDTEDHNTEATRFRNGDENLHFLHLKSVKKTLNCQTCHEIHASEQDSLIRTFGEFNIWKLPIQYRKTIDGGTCLTACHKDKTYSRKMPFVNEVGR